MNNDSALWKWLAVAGIAACVGATTLGVAISSHATDDESAEDHEGWFNYVDYYAGGADEIDEIRSGLIDDIDGAEEDIDAAISGLDDDDIRDALIDAADRGVEVRIVADELFDDDEDFLELVGHDDISVVFGDGELSYLPEPNVTPLLEHCAFFDHDEHITCTGTDEPFGNTYPVNNPSREMVRPAHYNSMSHTFFLIDDTEVWNISAPLTEDHPVWMAFRAISEEMNNSFGREFRQMHGGVFSTTLSVYNGPLKSLTHQYPLRFTNRGQLRVRFNPQERLVKNVVDETYRARSSVFVVTDKLTNEDLINALSYKVDEGFDVQVLLGEPTETLDDEIAALDPVYAPEEMGELPTMVIFDSESDRNDRRQPRTVQILSHELWRAQPFEVIANPEFGPGDDAVRFYPSDTFADGVMWEVLETGYDQEEATNPEVDRFVDVWQQLWAEANDE